MSKQQLIDSILNKQFTRLYVYATEIGKDKRLVACCNCSCGNKVKLNASNVKNGKKKSCGCLWKEHKATFLANKTRGKQPGHTKPSGEAAMNYVYKNYKSSALKRNLSFDIVKERFRVLTKQNCHYCCAIPTTIMKCQDKSRKLNGDYVYNGLDRIDSSMGYKEDNVVTCCQWCNKLKSDLVSYEEFKEVIKILKAKRGSVIW